MARRTRASVVASATEWLRARFPTPYPVTVRWVPRLSDGAYGQTTRHGRRIVISLSKSACRTLDTALEVLFHEHAHAVDWRHERVERAGYRLDHGDEFWLVLGRIHRAWHEEVAP